MPMPEAKFIVTTEPVPFADLIEQWTKWQTEPRHVVRWGHYVHIEQRNKHFDYLAAEKQVQIELLSQGDLAVRKQDNLQHQYSIARLGSLLAQKIKIWQQTKNINEPFDNALLIDALLLHDQGEVELKRDILYHFKKESDDLDEANAFADSIRNFEPAERDYYLDCFLLQFCRKDIKTFPEIYKQRIAKLAKSYPQEAIVFEALERWDYLLFCLEQYWHYKNIDLLAKLIDQQKGNFDELAAAYPPIKIFIWSSEVRKWCLDLLADYLKTNNVQH